jgi:hypothetical protein
MNVFSIFLGDIKTMYLRAVNAVCEEPAGPLDLTSCTEIDVALPNADGTIAHFLLSLDEVAIAVPKNLGKFSVPLSAIKSALLNPGEYQNFDVTFTISGSKFTVRYGKALSVFEVR